MTSVGAGEAGHNISSLVFQIGELKTEVGTRKEQHRKNTEKTIGLLNSKKKRGKNSTKNNKN